MAIGTTAAILGATGIASNVIGGIFGAKAATSAGNEQAAAAEREAQEILKVIAAQNPELAKAAEEAIAKVQGASETAAGGVEAAGAGAQQGAQAATTEANKLLDPYVKAGTGALGDLGTLANEKFQFTQDDPSYQFRLMEGMKALERSGAARGIVSGGRPLKEITRYAQNAASQEYQSAFDRFIASQGLKASTLGTVAGMGLTAGGKAGDNLMGTSRYVGDVGLDTARTAGGIRTGAAEFGANVGLSTADKIAQNNIRGAETAADLRTSAAAARAAGKVGRANAITGAISGAGQVAGDIGGYLSLKDIMKNPATTRPITGRKVAAVMPYR